MCKPIIPLALLVLILFVCNRMVCGSEVVAKEGMSTKLLISALKGRGDQFTKAEVVYRNRIDSISGEATYHAAFDGEKYTGEISRVIFGFDGKTYYHIDPINAVADFGSRAPEVPFESTHNPRLIGSIEPRLLTYMAAHVDQIMQAPADQAGVVTLKLTVPKSAVQDAFASLVPICMVGTEVTIWIDLKNGVTPFRQETRATQPPYTGCLGTRLLWDGWSERKNQLWLPAHYRIENYKTPKTQEEGDGPLGFACDYWYDKIDVERKFSDTDFAAPEVPAGFRVKDYRDGKIQYLLLAQPLRISDHRPGTLVAWASSKTVASTAIKPRVRQVHESLPTSRYLVYIVVVAVAICLVLASVVLLGRRKSHS
jgi:hypothetical protein